MYIFANTQMYGHCLRAKHEFTISEVDYIFKRQYCSTLWRIHNELYLLPHMPAHNLLYMKAHLFKQYVPMQRKTSTNNNFSVSLVNFKLNYVNENGITEGLQIQYTYLYIYLQRFPGVVLCVCAYM